MQVGLSCYSLTYSFGLMKPLASRAPLTIFDLMDKAEAAGLAGIEISWHLVPGIDKVAGDAAAVRDELQRRGLFIIIDSSGHDPDKLRRAVDCAEAVGAEVVRTMISPVLGGDRRPFAGKWQAHLHDVGTGLRAAARYAEQKRIRLGVENHQDLTSAEMVELVHRVDSDHFGLILDIGNALGVGEHPISYAERVAPFVWHAHIKDYFVHWSEEGYRLVRAPIGQGVVDFAAVRRILEAGANYPVKGTIEIGALSARHVRIFEDDFWPEYPERQARDLARALQLCRKEAQPAGAEWRTAYELEQGEAAVLAAEESAVQASLPYIYEVFGRSDTARKGA
ncbi:MAG TPA: sugar phosphate isomerase/epimerase family protein [Limnochordia bacterium]|nr:sugar phosphate isomerase/epimerase family protein [Limnochordia bacterium]